ncbi:MAG: DNA repair protein RecO [Deltaproteobacteria bacterium]|nr:DNA repair protein RecO [Deltaproteobacteria bacterium]MBW2253446.1 DNA repair protein RecO [Deltaproteobacteria bacterium]
MTDALLAVVVGTVDYGEADRIVRLLSAEEGRSAVMARQARSSRRRFQGALDFGTQVRVHRRKGRGGLPLLTGVDVVHAPTRARGDLDRIALLAYGCEVCAGLAPEYHEAPRLFRLLVTWLDVLESDEPIGAASRLALESKALTFAGLTPALLTCARCALPLDDPAAFDPEAGGGLHLHCGSGRDVRAELLREIEDLRRTPLAHTTARITDPGTHWLLSDFIRHQLGRDLRTRRLLEDLETAANGGGIG